MDEETLRASLDARGVLREDRALAPPDASQAYVVFAQAADARFDEPAIARSAERFFGTTLALVVPKRYEGYYPDEDIALVDLKPATIAAGARLCWGRRRKDGDLWVAEAAERRSSSGGLYDLAQRCGYVWLVGVESDTDRTALLLAAILASVLLGPILSPGGAEIFGVRTARAKLEEGRSTYR